jgi:uncharacterized membrane protein
MGSMPLHPAIVHLPLALAILMPLVAAGFGWALWTGRLRPRAWLAVVAFQALLLGSALVATSTGEAEEERVENVIQESALHAHEALADQFVWAGGVTLVLAGLVLVVRRPAATRVLVSGVVAATVVVAGMGLRVGHAGGQLVYVHGAASAYAQPSATPAVHRVDRD